MPPTHPLQAKLRRVLPPAVVSSLRRWGRRRVLLGDYGSWAEARAASSGYDDTAVFAKVLSATQEVAEGRAKWDRDGAVFETDEVNEPLLAVLCEIAAENAGVLDLVDFGGALGSTWRQHRRALADLKAVRWRVVEQAHYVEAGQPFADSTLSFHPSIDGAFVGSSVSTLLLSSVLPYIEHPGDLLAGAAARGVPHLVIDRTSFAADEKDHLVVQQAPPELGGGSYPCWLFDRARLFEPLAERYRLAREWHGFDDVDRRAVFRGFHFVRK